MTREKVTSDLAKVREQIEKLRQKEKQLQAQKKELDDIELVKTANKMGITPEQLYFLENLTEQEIQKLIAERTKSVEEKENVKHENQI